MTVQNSKEGFISFVRPVNTDTITSLLVAAKTLMTKGCENINLSISSPGGNLISGFSAYNELVSLPVNLRTFNAGSVESVALILYLAGQERYCAPNTLFKFHPFNWTFSTNVEISYGQIQEAYNSLTEFHSEAHKIIEKRTKLTEENANEMFHLTKTVNFEEAIDLGISNGTKGIEIEKTENWYQI